MDDFDLDVPRGSTSLKGASVWISLGLIGIVTLGTVAYLTLRPKAGPPPAGIAGDPLLVRGREVYLDRCASCHGATGVGDGPTAKGLPGPPVGNLTDAEWKHGDAPDVVLGLIRSGVKDAQMPAWGPYLREADLKAVSAYIYELAGRPVPGAYRVR